MWELIINYCFTDCTRAGVGVLLDRAQLVSPRWIMEPPVDTVSRNSAPLGAAVKDVGEKEGSSDTLGDSNLHYRSIFGHIPSC